MWVCGMYLNDGELKNGDRILFREPERRGQWGGGSESKSEGNTKIGTSGNPQRTTQRRIQEDLNPKKK